jgi:hypothetical protein
MGFFGSKKEKLGANEISEDKERESNQAERFRDRFREFITDGANFDVAGLPFAGFYVDSKNISEVKAILEKEGYEADDIDLESEKSFQPDDGKYIFVPTGDDPDTFMVRVGFKKEHIL